MLWCSATEHMMQLRSHWQAVTFGRTDMRHAIIFVSTIAILSVLGSLLYFNFTVTLFVASCIILVAFILSISWAFGRYTLNEIIDPIREKYKMNTVFSKDFGSHKNAEDAARKNGQDIRTVEHLLSNRSETFRRIGFIESLPEWIVMQALPFLAVSAPKWIIAVIIGVLIIRFHEDIIPHGREEQIQSAQNEVTLQIKISGNTKREDNDRNSVIDVGDYCMNVHSSSNVIILSNDGCN